MQNIFAHSLALLYLTSMRPLLRCLRREDLEVVGSMGPTQLLECPWQAEQMLHSSSIGFWHLVEETGDLKFHELT